MRILPFSLILHLSEWQMSSNDWADLELNWFSQGCASLIKLKVRSDMMYWLPGAASHCVKSDIQRLLNKILA